MGNSKPTGALSLSLPVSLPVECMHTYTYVCMFALPSSSQGKRASQIDEPLHIAIFFTVLGLCAGTIILSAFSLEEFGYREMRVTGGNSEKKRVYGRAQLFLGFMKLDAQVGEERRERRRRRRARGPFPHSRSLVACFLFGCSFAFSSSPRRCCVPLRRWASCATTSWWRSRRRATSPSTSRR